MTAALTALPLLVPVGAAHADHTYGQNAALVAPADGARVSGSAYRVRVSDPDAYYIAPALYLDGVELRLPNSEDAEGIWNYVWDTTTLANGSYSLAVGGSEGPNSKPAARITVTNVAPTVTITSPAEGGSVAGTFTAAADVIADQAANATISKVTFAFPDADFQSVVTDFTAPYAANVATDGFFEGANRVVVTAYDSQGLSSQATRTFTVDNTPPVQLLSPTANSTISGVVTIRARDGEDGGVGSNGLSLYLDGQSVDSYSRVREADGDENYSNDVFAWRWDTRTVSNGTHQIQFGAEDYSEGPKTAPVSVTVHNVAPPAMRISHSTGLVTAGQTVTVNVVTQPGEKVNLVGYSRPSTTFRTLRSAVADSSGRVMFTLKPNTNTRYYAVSAADPERKTGSLAVSVRPRISLDIYQEDRDVIFWGMSVPCVSGRAVAVYRLTSTGRVLTTTGRLDCRAGYANISVYKSFTGRGTFNFVAVTAADATNAAAQSNIVRFTVG